MTVLYKPYQSSVVSKSGKKLFYPRVVRTGNVGTSTIAEEIAEYSSLSRGDVKNTIDNLITVLTRHLQSSQTVTLEGLGTFRMVMRAGGKGVETAKEVSASQASLTVRFQPCTTKNLDHSVATRSMVTGVKCMRFDLADAAAPDGEVNPDPNPDGGDEEAPDPTV